MGRSRRVVVDGGFIFGGQKWSPNHTADSQSFDPGKHYLTFELQFSVLFGRNNVSTVTLWDIGVLSFGGPTPAQIDFVNTALSPFPDPAKNHAGFPGEFVVFDFNPSGAFSPDGVEIGLRTNNYSYADGVVDFIGDDIGEPDLDYNFSDAIPTAFFELNGNQVILVEDGVTVIDGGLNNALGGIFIGTLELGASSVMNLHGTDYDFLSDYFTYFADTSGNDFFSSELNDLINGSAVADRLFALRGDDEVYGNEGDDYIEAGRGNDFVRGGPGADEISGGTGDDDIDGGGDNDIIAGEGGSDSLRGGPGNDTISGGASNDFIDGGSGDDQLTGNGGSDEIHGGSGIDAIQGGLGLDLLFGEGDDDTIDGQGGADTIFGGLGNDTLNGGPQNDVIDGQGGNDHITGGTGKDTSTGGSGADVFHYNAVDFAGLRTTADRITDFSQSDGDMIDLSTIDAAIAVPGNQAFTFIGTAAFSGVKGELHYLFDSGSTYVEGDRNGDTVADFAIRLDGLINLQATDFIL